MEELRFDGQVALVTGGGAGMGRAFSEFLAQRGATVIVSDAGTAIDGGGGDTSVAQSVVDAIVAAGGTAIAYTADLSNETGAAGAVQLAKDRFGRLDILIHNAGIALSTTFAEETPERMDKLLAINTRAACILAQRAWPLMLAQNYGRMVFIGSTAHYGMAGAVHYAMAKASYLGLVRSLADEVGEANIRVNLVAPSGATRLADTLAESEFKRWFFATMKSELVTPIVAYLAHRDCKVSGEAFAAAGGRLARIVIGETQGIIDPDLTAEKVPNLIDQVVSEGRLHIYRNYNESGQLLMHELGYTPTEPLGTLMDVGDSGGNAD